MWKKDEMPEPTSYPRPEPVLSAPRPAAPMESATPRQQATIGSSITIRGDVTGDEDLLIQGRVDGSVDLKQHSVTIGHEGQVKADISGRIIAVEGRVEGNLRADEQVILRASAVVQGDIVAPRVVLEDGARFRGGIDMGEMTAATGNPRPAAARVSQVNRTTPAPAAETPRPEPTTSPSAAMAKPDTAAKRTLEVSP